MTRPIKLTAPQQERFNRVVKQLLRWYKKNERPFVWRSLRRTPYEVLVSEVMLQQTQASTLEKRLPPFLKQFPTVAALAKASTTEVLRAWQGLGYNRRALNLHKTAKAIKARGRKGFPSTMSELLALPGIGDYTASAILTFSFGDEIPVVDVNIERVLSRVWKRMPATDAKLPIKEIATFDAMILPRGHSSMWHQALMDLGATICAKRKPLCQECPISSQCRSAKGFMKLALEQRPTVFLGSTEKLFWGEPRRLWRGRVLKLVAKSNGIALEALSIASQEFLKTDESVGFDAFIKSIISDLCREGFVRELRPTIYALAE